MEKSSSNTRLISRLTRDTLALVMAGGRGSRLHQLTVSRAKPAVHFGGKFRIIDFTLSNCVNSGIRRIGVLTQYKSHSLIQHLQSGWGFLGGHNADCLEVLPADQTCDNSMWYAGTADAVYQNIECIRAHNPSYVLILAGDHVYKMDYGEMIAHHVESNAQVTIGCIEVPLSDAKEFGILQIDSDTRVKKFVEKSPSPSPLPGKPDMALASMGIYVFDTKFLLDSLTDDAGRTLSSHDFGKDVIPRAINAGRVFAYPFRDLYDENKPGYWRDVGTVDAYWRANMELTNVTPELNLYDENWPVWTQQEQVPPAKFVFDDARGRGFAIDSLVSGGCIVSGAMIHHSLLFVQARAETGSFIQDSLLLPNSSVGKGCRIHRAIIDAGCQIPDGMEIGVDLTLDAQRFYITPDGVTLVTRDMLENGIANEQHLQRNARSFLTVHNGNAAPALSPLPKTSTAHKLHVAH
jgi:glucose-1-phosphate adenylyltransferase